MGVLGSEGARFKRLAMECRGAGFREWNVVVRARQCLKGALSESELARIYSGRRRPLSALAP